MSGLPAEALELRLVVTGRKSGAKRSIRLWFIVLDGRPFVMAGEPQRSHWLRNVQANPQVEVEIGGRSWRATATSANAGPDDSAIRAAFGEKYGTKYLRRWLAESHPVAIDFAGEVEAGERGDDTRAGPPRRRADVARRT